MPLLLLGLNNTANPPDKICPLETICGFGGESFSLCDLCVAIVNIPKASMGKTLASGSGLFLPLGVLLRKSAQHAFRFITPIFLHAGFIHILLNLFAQLALSAQVYHSVCSCDSIANAY